MNIMIQIKVSKEFAETLKWKFNNIDTERKYLLDALCETINTMYQSMMWKHLTT